MVLQIPHMLLCLQWRSRRPFLLYLFFFCESDVIILTVRGSLLRPVYSIVLCFFCSFAANFFTCLWLIYSYVLCFFLLCRHNIAQKEITSSQNKPEILQLPFPNRIFENPNIILICCWLLCSYVLRFFAALPSSSCLGS